MICTNSACKWGLVGRAVLYPRQSNMDIDQALNVISADLLLVKDGDGNEFWPSMAIDSLGFMKPGLGYQIFMNQAAELSFPD